MANGTTSYCRVAKNNDHVILTRLLRTKQKPYFPFTALRCFEEATDTNARIFWSGSSWMLEDLNSSNGSFIGEFQAARRLSGNSAIQEGDIFRVGLTRLRLGGAKNGRTATAGAAVAAPAKSS